MDLTAPAITPPIPMPRSHRTQELAQRLRAARQRARIQQYAAAEALAVSRGTICSMENGTRKVGALELAILARLYERPLEYFVAEELRPPAHSAPPAAPPSGACASGAG